MKKQYILKTIVVILLVVLALSLVGCLGFGSQNDYIYSEISVSEDGKEVKITPPGGATEKTYHYLGTATNALLFGKKYLYREVAYMADGTPADVWSPLADRNVLYLDCYGTVYAYATEDATEGKEYVQDFLKGEGGRRSFANLSPFSYGAFGYSEGVLNEREVETFFFSPKAEDLVTVEVNTLEQALVYDVLTYDFYRVLACKSGAIFRYDSGYIFVDYDRLDNSAFDSEGNFSYRKGTVEAEKLTGEKLEILRAIQGRQIDIEDDYKNEEGLYVGEKEEEMTFDTSYITAIVTIVVLGLLLPLAPAVFVLVNTLTARKRSLALGEGGRVTLPIPYITMLIGSVLWFVAGVALFVIFIVI